MAVFSGKSSCMKCPASGNTCRLYLPKRDSEISHVTLEGRVQFIIRRYKRNKRRKIEICIYTLHLTNSQFRVQPVGAGKEQELPAPRSKKLAAQAREPVLPVRLRGSEVGPPLPGAGIAGLLLAQAQQRGDAGAGRDGVADGPRPRVPLDAGLEGLEAGGARRQVRVHVLQGVDGGALDDVEHGVAEERGAEPPGARELRHHGAAHRVPDEDHGRELGPLHLPPRELDRGEQVVGERREAQVQGRLPLGDHHRLEPWPLASSEKTPADGSRLRIWSPTTANESPDDPPPWCITKRGPWPTGEVR